MYAIYVRLDLMVRVCACSFDMNINFHVQLVGPNFASFDEHGSEKNSIWRKQISSSIVRLR